jgi:hypothetical protein
MYILNFHLDSTYYTQDGKEEYMGPHNIWASFTLNMTTEE